MQFHSGRHLQGSGSADCGNRSYNITHIWLCDSQSSNGKESQGNSQCESLESLESVLPNHHGNSVPDLSHGRFWHHGSRASALMSRLCYWH